MHMFIKNALNPVYSAYAMCMLGLNAQWNHILIHGWKSILYGELGSNIHSPKFLRMA